MRQVMIAAVLFGTALIAGCGGTSVSRQPSTSEIEDAKQRRLAEVDKLEGLTPAQKQAMKDHIAGGTGAARRGPQGGK